MLHSLLLLFHSSVRYFVLIFLLVILYRSFQGWQGKKEYAAMDDKLSLWLFMLTHTQLLLGLILFFISPIVVFSGASMKDAVARYWLVEHSTLMLIAVTLITVARISSKRISEGAARHRRIFILNLLALIAILTAIAMSGRGFFSLPA